MVKSKTSQLLRLGHVDFAILCYNAPHVVAEVTVTIIVTVTW